MTKGIDLSVAADTRAAMSAITRGLIDPLEDVSDLFDALGTDSKDAGNDVERSMRDAGRAGKDAGDDLEKAMRDAQRRTVDAKDEISDLRDELRKAGRAGREAGNEAGDGLGRVKEGAQEVTQEMGQNLGQAVSSFRGDMTDLAQVWQDTLGGLAASVAAVPGFGIPAAAALAVGAAGFGLVMNGVDQTKEKQEELNQAAADWAQAYMDSAGQIIDAAAVVAKVQEIATDPDQYKKAGENAKNWGADVTTTMRAMAGDGTALDIVQKSLNDRQNAWNDTLRAAKDNAAATRGESMNLTRAQQEAGKELFYGQQAWSDLNGSMVEGRQRAQNAASALFDIATNSGIATGEVDDLGNKIIEVNGQKIVVNAETKTASTNVDAFENNYKTKFKNISDYNNALIRDAGKVAVEVDKLGNKVVTLPSGKQIFIDAKTKKASEDLSRFQGDFDKKVQHMSGTKVVMKVDDSALRNYKPPRFTIPVTLNPRTDAITSGKVRKALLG